jgi:hypothetical protein
MKPRTDADLMDSATRKDLPGGTSGLCVALLKVAESFDELFAWDVLIVCE